MNVSVVVTLLFGLLAIAGIAWVAGIGAGAFAQWPWWKIFLVAFPVAGTAFVRLRRISGR